MTTNEFCDEWLEDDPSDGWGGTYCKLRAGHDGAHSAHYPVFPVGPHHPATGGQVRSTRGTSRVDRAYGDTQ